MCIFCDIVQNEVINKDFPENIILDSTENFYVKSALGQFINGYVLINSKKHFPNFSFINSNKLHSELESLIFKTKQILLNIVGETNFIIFEHGSINKLCFNTECNSRCIDHAHLHIIPANINLEEELKKLFYFIKINSVLDLGRYKKDSYIYYYSTQSDEKYLFEISNFIPSQYMRQLICKKLQIADCWNWAEHPFRERINQFNNQYLSALALQKYNTASNKV